MNRTTRVVVGVFGAIAALAGLEHGVGEILQGPGRPESIMFASWPDARLFRVFAGEPAMSIVPDMRVSGIITVALSLLLLGWTAAARRRVSLGTAVIALLLLVSGGGFGPPLLALLVALAASRLNAPLTWWRRKAPAGLRRLLAGAWPAVLAGGVAAWLTLMPGLMLLDAVAGLPGIQALVPGVTLAAFGGLGLSAVSGFARDAARGPERGLNGHTDRTRVREILADGRGSLDPREPGSGPAARNVAQLLHRG